ncbi:hypothetical protein Abr02nite_67250 [Paractinoplanes brasiliensis]|nr:hypothetical protein Abr02nite_67250 [Actinoplanes brasiliensis]
MIRYALLSLRYTFRILATLEECAAGRSAAPFVQVGQDLLRGRAGSGREPIAGWAENDREAGPAPGTPVGSRDADRRVARG